MQITAILFGTHARLLPPSDQGRASVDVPAGSTVEDVLDALAVPAQERTFLTVDGERVAPRPAAARGRRAARHRAAGRRLTSRMDDVPGMRAQTSLNGQADTARTPPGRRPSPSRRSGIPLYYQVMRDLKEQILSGKLGPGQQLPSEARAHPALPRQPRGRPPGPADPRRAGPHHPREGQGHLRLGEGRRRRHAAHQRQPGGPHPHGPGDQHQGRRVPSRQSDARPGRGLRLRRGHGPLPRPAGAARRRQAARRARQPRAVRRRRLHLAQRPLEGAAHRPHRDAGRACRSNGPLRSSKRSPPTSTWPSCSRSTFSRRCSS